MKDSVVDGTKYGVRITREFKKDLRRVSKQSKNMEKFDYVVTKIANGEELEDKYRNHYLIDNKKYRGCMECHIEPDWLLVYKIVKDELILLLINTGSHSSIFK